MSSSEMHPRTQPRVEPRLLDKVRDTIRRKHYSLRTEATYIDWIKGYIFFHRKRHPAEMGAPEMEFLNHLAGLCLKTPVSKKDTEPVAVATG